jgi:hypothetical protein
LGNTPLTGIGPYPIYRAIKAETTPYERDEAKMPSPLWLGASVGMAWGGGGGEGVRRGASDGGGVGGVGRKEFHRYNS